MKQQQGSTSSVSNSRNLFFLGGSSVFSSSWVASSIPSLLVVIGIVVVLVLLISLLIKKWNLQKLQRQRQQELDQWILKARQERNSKQFHVLKDYNTTTTKWKKNNNKKKKGKEDHSHHSHSHSHYHSGYRPTATETIQLLRTNQLDLLDNIRTVAYDCRHYGRNENGVNAITQELYDIAYEQGVVLVQEDEETITKKVLYGIPISVKDRFAIQNQLQTGGLACRLQSPASHGSLLIQLLKDSGAIPICISNTMQTMVMGECINHIWGRTCNPWNLSRTTGGSSGGDAALVAMDCVPIGLGADLGGSIRIPACWCGIIGYKPTSTRLSMIGNMTPRYQNKISGQSLILPSSPGPLTRCVNDCVLFLQAICVPKLWNTDQTIPPIPFNVQVYQRTATATTRSLLSGKREGGGGDLSSSSTTNTTPASTLTDDTPPPPPPQQPLRLLYFDTDDWFQPCTTAIRALQETISNLTTAGHICIKIPIPTNGWFNYGLLLRLGSAEGNLQSIRDGLEGEPFTSEFATILKGVELSDTLRWIARQVVDKRKSFLLGCSRRNGCSGREFLQAMAELAEMRKKWMTIMVQEKVFPTLPLPAMPHGIVSRLTPVFSYTMIANLLQWPAGTVPTTIIRDDEQHYYHYSTNHSSSSSSKHTTTTNNEQHHDDDTSSHRKVNEEPRPLDEEQPLLSKKDAQHMKEGRGGEEGNNDLKNESSQGLHLQQQLPKDQCDGYAMLADTVVMKNSAGLPLGVTVMSTPFSDETCLGVMKQVEQYANFTDKPTAYLFENSLYDDDDDA